jgi:hypothetical protein
MLTRTSMPLHVAVRESAMGQSGTLDYHISEYNLLRQELIQNFKDSYSSVTYAVLANAAIITWISSNLPQPSAIRELLIPAALLPIFISLVAWSLYLLRRRSIQRISDYCEELEKRFGEPDLGWERFYGRRMEGTRLYIRSNWVFNVVCFVQLGLSTYFLYFVLTRL